MAWFRIVRRRRVVVRRKRTSKRGRLNYLAHKEAARTLVHERLAHFNALYGFAFKKVFIRDQKTRWGSCSKSGNLNFNYKLALLPPELTDYVVVHELCHLKEFNHSKDFWALVAQSVPDHKARRARLRNVAHKLR